MRGVADVTRLFTMSIADLLDDFFESPQMHGVLSVSGVIGTWAGPRSPGTAYVMAHHKIGDVGDGELGSWGFPEGGMGGAHAARMRRAARSFGAEVRTDAPVAAHRRARRPRRRRRARVGRGAVAPTSSSRRRTRRSRSSTTSTATTLPADFVRDIERWNTRSGTVKVNVAVDRLPEFTSKPGFDPEVHGGTIVLARSLDDVEGAFQDAVGGQRRERGRSPTSASRRCSTDTLAPEGHHIVSMFTQWVPHEWAGKPMPAELDAYADRVDRDGRGGRARASPSRSCTGR